MVFVKIIMTFFCCIDETDKYFYVLFSHDIYLDNYFLQRSWTRLVYNLTLPYSCMKVGWVVCASFWDNRQVNQWYCLF